MKTSFVVLAFLGAIGFAGAAFAEEATKGSPTGPAAMTDSQMDAVTAGVAGGQGNTFGADRAAAVKVNDPNGPSGGNKAFGQSQGKP